MNRKVLLLSQSFNKIKYANLQLTASASRDLVENPFRPVVLRSGRWKIQSAYGDIGVRYRDDETVAYVASRMPSVYASCHRVLREVQSFSFIKILFFFPRQITLLLMSFAFELWVCDCRSAGGCQSFLHPKFWTLVLVQAQLFGKLILCSVHMSTKNEF